MEQLVRCQGASLQHNNNALQQLGSSILPRRPSLLPKNSLGALLLDFQASLRPPSGDHHDFGARNIGMGRDSNDDLEDVLRQLTSGDVHALDQELEAVSAKDVFSVVPDCIWTVSSEISIIMHVSGPFRSAL